MDNGMCKSWTAGSPDQQKCKQKKEWATMVILCGMRFWFWKLVCQHVFSSTGVSCWIT